MNPTPIATMMLLLWPLAAILLFARLDRVRAFLWTIIGSYMFLPPAVAIDLPAVPAVGKIEMASIMAAIMVASTNRKAMLDPDYVPPMRLPGSIALLMALYLIASILTVITNTDALIEGVSYRPGMTPIDTITATMRIASDLVPFILAYRLLSGTDGVKVLLETLSLALLIYSVPMLIEVRMSPQMNVWVYGYFQHDFVQTMRYGGFRPIVFMEHPIWVASFTTAAFLGSACLSRAYPDRPNRITVVLYQAAMLLICKTMTAWLLTLVALPLILFARPRVAISIAVGVGIFSLLYPVFRIQGWVPTDTILRFVNDLSPERAASLKFRFDNEVILLERGLERPLFGWGGWGRNFPVDPTDGRTAAIADGAWVISMGSRGAIGFIAQYLLLVSPLLVVWRARKRLLKGGDQAGALMIACLAVLLAVNMVELIPNATLTPITWLIAGALLGNATRLRQITAERVRVSKLQPIL